MKFCIEPQILQTQPVTCFLMLIIFAFSLAGFLNKYFFFRMMLRPYQVVRHHDYQQVLTADLVHINLLHLLVNEASLFFICGKLEQHLKHGPAGGSLAFAVIYLASLLTGAVVTLLLYRNDPEYSSAGASGSIMGCLFGLMYLEPKTIALYLPFIGPVTNEYYALLYIVAMVVMKRRLLRSGVNYSVHLWGAFGGIITTVLITHFR